MIRARRPACSTITVFTCERWEGDSLDMGVMPVVCMRNELSSQGKAHFLLY